MVAFIPFLAAAAPIIGAGISALSGRANRKAQKEAMKLQEEMADEMKPGPTMGESQYSGINLQPFASNFAGQMTGGAMPPPAPMPPPGMDDEEDLYGFGRMF